MKLNRSSIITSKELSLQLKQYLSYTPTYLPPTYLPYS